MIVIGIDPGLTGALAMIGPRKEYLKLADIPVMKRLGPKAEVKNQVNGAALEEILRAWTEDYDKNEIVAFIETPIAFPGQHVATIASAFLTAGIIEGVLSARHFVHQLVRPADWKKAMALSKDKDQARARAIRLYPEAPLALAKHHNRAEALLIARYGHDQIA